MCNIFVSGLSTLLDENRVTELAVLYQLFSKVKGGLSTLLQFWRDYIKVYTHYIHRHTTQSITFKKTSLFISQSQCCKLCLVSVLWWRDCMYTRERQGHGARTAGL